MTERQSSELTKSDFVSSLREFKIKNPLFCYSALIRDNIGIDFSLLRSSYAQASDGR